MKQPPRLTRRSLVAVLAASSAVGAKAQQQPAARPARVRDAAASVRSRPAPRNSPPSFRFIPY